MTHRLTDDEKFLVALATKTQPDESADLYLLAQSIGMTPRRIESIAVQLIRTNFIRRRGTTEVVLTEHGRRLAASMKDAEGQR